MISLKNIIVLILFLGSGFSFAQNLPVDYLSADFHKERRQQLRARLPENSVAVFFANAVRNRANDVDYIYHQDPNFYYLTGYKEPNAVLLIFKDKQLKKDGLSYDEIIFVQPRDERSEMWNGRRLGSAGVREQLAFEEVFINTDFKDYNLDFSTFDQVLFFDFKNDVRDDKRNEGDLFDLISQFKVKVGYPDPNETRFTAEPTTSNLNISKLYGIMRELRGIKTSDEIELLRKAINISTIGQVEVMKAMHPGMSETEIQGIHEFVYKKYGAEYEGYPSIVGAGNNGCILHYIENNKPEIKDGELVLMDLGAEYHGYTADVTRTIPVSGKFSNEQKAIYNIVLKAQSEAIKASVAGTSWSVTGKIARDIVNEGLFELGIIDSVNQQHNYYPHGLSHHIGLDVHDLGSYTSLSPGMVITVEPGIYIPEGSECDSKWWGIAVRIEDDILIKPEGQPELLSYRAPRTVEEIEKLMTEASVLNQLTLPTIDKK